MRKIYVSSSYFWIVAVFKLFVRKVNQRYVTFINVFTAIANIGDRNFGIIINRFLLRRLEKLLALL